MSLSTIRNRLLALLVTMSLVATLGLAIPFVTTNALLTDLEASTTRAIQATSAFARLSQALGDEETGLRGYLLTGDDDFLAPYTRGRSVEQQAFADLEAATSGRADIQRLILGVRVAAETWQTDYALKVIAELDANRADRAASASSLRRGKVFFEQLRGSLAALGTPLGQPDAEITGRVASLIQTRTVLVGGIVILLLFTLILATLLIRSWVSKPLQTLVRTARRVERGEAAEFAMGRRDELGDLAAALERMRLRIQTAQVVAEDANAQSSVINRFTELTAFATTDVLVAEATLVALSELTKPAQGIVHVSNHSQDRATPEGVLGDTPAETLTLGMLATCPGVRRGSPYVTVDVEGPLAVRCPVFAAESGTVACIPLIANAETIGAVHLRWERPEALSLADRAIVSRIAEHAALTIGNRRLVLALQGMASTDARTGMANSRAFDKALEAALDRSGGSELHGVLLLDLDHFKHFNDRYGHPAGDEALRVFAGIVRASIREGDHAARYGGEEFAVHLPGLDMDGSREVAERIRERTEATIVPLGPGVTGRLTCSIGVAVAPADGTDRMRLLQAADTALYRAKDAGRNRVATTQDPKPVEERRVTRRAS